MIKLLTDKSTYHLATGFLARTMPCMDLHFSAANRLDTSIPWFRLPVATGVILFSFGLKDLKDEPEVRTITVCPLRESTKDEISVAVTYFAAKRHVARINQRKEMRIKEQCLKQNKKREKQSSGIFPAVCMCCMCVHGFDSGCESVKGGISWAFEQGFCKTVPFPQGMNIRSSRDVGCQITSLYVTGTLLPN